MIGRSAKLAMVATLLQHYSACVTAVEPPTQLIIIIKRIRRAILIRVGSREGGREVWRALTVRHVLGECRMVHLS